MSLSEAARRYRSATTAQQAARETLYTAIREAHHHMTIRQIAEHVQLSYQRVAQIVNGGNRD